MQGERHGPHTDGSEIAPGAHLFPCYLAAGAQHELAALILARLKQNPLYTPTMPRSGKPMSVRMTNFGPLGWVTDKQGGYRYQERHPVTGRPWGDMPAPLLALWDELAGHGPPPQACLVNYYDADARLGLHRDEDEEDFSAPVLSVSLGDDCLFRLGGLKRSDPARSFRLASGDVLLLSGDSRLAFHGVTRIYAGTSGLLPGGGRINLTLRRVTGHG